MNQNVGIFCFLQQLPFDFALVSNLELFFVDLAFLWMRFGHVASKLLWSLELAPANRAFVDIWFLVIFQMFGSLLDLSLIWNDDLTLCLILFR